MPRPLRWSSRILMDEPEDKVTEEYAESFVVAHTEIGTIQWLATKLLGFYDMHIYTAWGFGHGADILRVSPDMRSVPV